MMSELRNTIHLGDCLDIMSEIPSGSIDMILCDLPYGTTANNWDNVIDFSDLWAHYERVIKSNGVIALTADQPFTTALISSNLKLFRYCLVWDKVGTTGFHNANLRPLKRHEDICIFYKSKPTYNPLKVIRGIPRKKGGSKTNNGCYRELLSAESFNNEYYPTSIVEVSNASKKGLLHPTQKPIALFEYLIKTYTNEGDTVLDNCMGSGTTCIAAKNCDRNYIGIEKDDKYFIITKNRIESQLF